MPLLSLIKSLIAKMPGTGDALAFFIIQIIVQIIMLIIGIELAYGLLKEKE